MGSDAGNRKAPLQDNLISEFLEETTYGSSILFAHLVVFACGSNGPKPSLPVTDERSTLGWRLGHGDYGEQQLGLETIGKAAPFHPQSNELPTTDLRRMYKGFQEKFIGLAQSQPWQVFKSSGGRIWL